MKHLIIMDLNALPIEYKENTIFESVKQYEKDFNVKVIPFDGARINTQGVTSNIAIKFVKTLKNK